MPISDSSTGGRLLGLATGVIFGALLEKGRLANQDAILGQLLFRDGRVGKTMGSAVVVGASAIHFLLKAGAVQKNIKPFKLGGTVGGAALFGAGLALLGYCPGTAVTAAGTGRKDAMAGVVGMLFGAGVFIASHAALTRLVEAGGDFGKITLPALLKKREAPLERGSSRGVPRPL